SVKYISYHKDKYIECETLVLATGGYSFPSTGSSGEGYQLAKDMGHTIAPCFPSLTGLLPKDYDTRLQGITLSNVQLSLKIDEIIEQEVFGEVIFTDLGFEGSLGYRLSRKVVTAMNHGHKPSLVLNLKAAIPLPELRSRLQNDYLKYTSESLSLFMRHYLPRELILPFLDAMRLKSNQLICKLLPENTETLLKGLTCWVFPIERYAGYERAIVTAGGVSIEEIQKKDMRSKIIDNLFFAGEIIDLDGDTGGYNLQIAFSTGVMAGLGAAKSAHRKT
ncbi:MAG: NAD(P)/FAD-dependent oxidoreductase, partial [Prevotellaceae bacterium]|nr:NAD(P)/FAD-dependent oxidoreductase [Prevotellaceae bacterium]